jgi:hypothetical protein
VLTLFTELRFGLGNFGVQVAVAAEESRCLPFWSWMTMMPFGR